MKRKVVVEYWGGFHENVPPIRFRFDKNLWDISSGSFDFCSSIAQKHKAQKHFCGMPSCICGGIYRAKWGIVK